MLKAPKFWYKKNNTIYSNTLYPFSLLFRFGTKLRYLFSNEKPSLIPTICIGNIVVGGAGKTPVSMKIAKMLTKAGYKPHFISKGYSGITKESTLVAPWHSPISVGDESLLLSEVAYTWIGKNRIQSSYLAKKNGADCLIMDDGFQNPSIKKDFSIIVVDGEQAFGNKRVMPSGPLRESIRRGFSRTNVVVVIGKISDELIKLIPATIPMFKAKFTIKKDNEIFKGKNVTAFAGIAYPNKFFKTLETQGASVIKKISYSDHYIYNENDLLSLVEIANKTKSILVTTRKDFVRIPKPYRSLINTLDGEIMFEKEDIITDLLSNVLENYYITQPKN